MWATISITTPPTPGRVIKILSVVGEHTCECLGGVVEHSITATRLSDELNPWVPARSWPNRLYLNDGPDQRPSAPTTGCSRPMKLLLSCCR
jgi:hypothetical protein